MPRAARLIDHCKLRRTADTFDLETDPNTPLRSSLLTGEAAEGFVADARSVWICGWRTLAG
jgi:hypothetical protein